MIVFLSIFQMFSVLHHYINLFISNILSFQESFAFLQRDVHTVLRINGLNPSRSVVSAPLALIRARDPVLVPSGPHLSGDASS